MNIFFRFLVGLFLAATVLASVVPVHEGNALLTRDVPLNTTDPYILTDGKAPPDPSEVWRDYSTVQTWIGGQKFIAVGTTIGSELYDIIWRLLDKECPNNLAENRCDSKRGNMCWATQSLRQSYPKGSWGGFTCIKAIQGEWQNGPKRNLLIGAVAGTLEALTKPEPTDGPTSNCFDVDGKKGCNVGNPIRVNFPPYDGKPNFMHIDLKDTYDGAMKWDCCSNFHRANVDAAIDGLSGEIAANFKAWDFSRQTKCSLIPGNDCS
ncbi:hypothetical protein HBI56_062360 [Parastagonospora nodorum]|uniref:Ecp2 effector protein domain-containing protein n=1 Tax=Phaeosphaeria nodorum (strain SN15 / ATCC MYA-4574 / FGSC 10173) TaxID=321614 RepID=A0A7U2F6R9_PHANO|nr:hypothetical protein HBH56_196860 [Parastagonospora nodorum]QRC97565.1 hypothetical protein JI435_086640 [Parastagonospora nodorum SN15]KAH3924741.1 hypothetical protein HBH54_189820 [Parastagonospora nodorum]KAH4036082.1 hypothetical protein HBI09_082510 [Parastagonospora nodorum]KAH4050271.1 hypothetical protein HBH49_130360 [Parastagonospora nodorum]